MAFSKHLNLQIGQRIKAKVEDISPGGALIVGYEGRLVRLTNTTHRAIARGEVLDLQVVAISPLEFRFFQKSQSLNRLV